MEFMGGATSLYLQKNLLRYINQANREAKPNPMSSSALHPMGLGNSTRNAQEKEAYFSYCMYW